MVVSFEALCVRLSKTASGADRGVANIQMIALKTEVEKGFM